MWVASEHAASEKHRRQLSYHIELQTLPDSVRTSDGMYDILDQNVIAKNSSSSDTESRCLLCRADFADKNAVWTHVESNRHKRNLDWYQRVQAAIGLGKFMSNRKTHPRRKTVPYEEDSYAKLRPFPEFIIEESIVHITRSLPAGIVVREWDYYCTCCGVAAMTDDSMIYHHSNTREHRSRAAHVERERRSRDGPFRVSKTDWETAVKYGLIPPPPLNRRPIHTGS